MLSKHHAAGHIRCRFLFVGRLLTRKSGGLALPFRGTHSSLMSQRIMVLIVLLILFLMVPIPFDQDRIRVIHGHAPIIRSVVVVLLNMIVVSIHHCRCLGPIVHILAQMSLPNRNTNDADANVRIVGHTEMQVTSHFYGPAVGKGWIAADNDPSFRNFRSPS